MRLGRKKIKCGGESYYLVDSEEWKEFYWRAEIKIVLLRAIFEIGRVQGIV